MNAITSLAAALLFTSAAFAQVHTSPPAGATPPPVREAENGLVASGRRPIAPGRITFAFRDEPIGEEVFSFIAEMTGKVVIPVGQRSSLEQTRITLVNDEPIERSEALDILFRSFRLNGVGVVEKEDVIIVGPIERIMDLKRLPVLTADDDVSQRQDQGSLVIKVFRVEQVAVEEIGAQIAERLPSHTEITIDVNSNQIVVFGDIAACRQIERLIDELDHNALIAETRTFVLSYADADEVADDIETLFAPDPVSAGPPARRGSSPGRPSGRASAAAPGPTIDLRIVVSSRQNSLTVVADPELMSQIAALVEESWDLPRPTGTSKVYVLKHTDPIVMRDTIRAVLGTGSGASSSVPGGVPRGQSGDPTGGMSGIYRFEAYADKNAIVAICKTEQAFDYLDDLIEKLDEPSAIGLPEKIALMHADAIQLADEINALLSDGGGIQLPRPERGLSGDGLEGSSDVSNLEAGERISFPWQGSRETAAGRTCAPANPLIGAARVVPIVRENALAILAPPAHAAALRQLIEEFDQPSRQVMISAIIVEVQLTDDFALGLRVSSGGIALNNTENSLGVDIGGSGTKAGFLDDLFDSSVLDASFNVSLALQALAGETNVRVLHEPRIFTADNMEAYFFDGQEVPFISDSNNFDQGGVNQSFDYRDVGLVLNVRPRITARNDVNLEVNVELSSVVPGQTLFGGFILDRRQAHSHVTMRNGETVVLSGLLRETESLVERRVPFLGDIPLIGELFKSRENSTVTSELLVFLTPHVIGDDAEAEARVRGEVEHLRRIARPLAEQPSASEIRSGIRTRMVPPPAAHRRPLDR